VANKLALAGAALSAMAIASALVTKWEGQTFVPYRDGGGVLTVCVGHTGPDVIAGRRYTQAECDAFKAHDLAIANGQVKRCLPMPMLPQIEGALTSATFNAGPRVVCGSTLQKRALANDWPGACKALEMWKYIGRAVSPGLLNRRMDERAVCEGRA